MATEHNFFKYKEISIQMNSKIFNFVPENGKLHFKIECILVKCPCCPLRFLSRNYGKSLGAMERLASRKSTSGLGLCNWRLVSCSLAPNPGDDADTICSSISIFLVVFYLMCSENLTVQKWEMYRRRRRQASYREVPWVLTDTESSTGRSHPLTIKATYWQCINSHESAAGESVVA